MIAKKCQIGSSFRSASEYLMHGTNAREPNRGIVIDSNIPGATPREWSRNVAAFRQLRPTLGKAVYHGSLNPAPGDRLLTDAELGEMARIFLDEMGFATCPYVIVRHPSDDDGEQHRPDHIHILALRINAKGETVSDRNDYKRAEAVTRRLETRFGLTPVPPSTTNHKNKETTTMTPEKQKAIEARLDEAHDDASMSLNLGMMVECGDDDLSERRKRDFKRELLSDAYQQAVRDTFLDSVRFVRRNAKGLTIHTTNGGRLVDSGDKVAAFAMAPQSAAEQLIEMAILKGWDSIVLRGDETFLRLAMAVALQKGLSVRPIDANQLQIWLAVKATHGGSGGGNGTRPIMETAPAPEPAAPATAVPVTVPADTPVVPVKPRIDLSPVAGLTGLGGILKRRQDMTSPQGTDSAGVPVNPIRPHPFKR
jgi:hypothetical protein